MKLFILCLAALSFFLMFCHTPPPVEQVEITEASPPIPREETPEPVETVITQESVPEEHFNVTREVYDHTLVEVQGFITELNKLISSKNFSKWENALSDKFFRRISSPEFLANMSESVALKSRKIVLKTPNDYFTHVVVPARSNSRVDEIEFVDIGRVKVYYYSISADETRRLRLYELIKAGDTWKIVD